MRPDIYTYIDYRLYLKDFLAYQKNRGKRLTQREVLKAMGISSTGFLANVLSGKQNLTIDQVKKLSRILGLSGNQSDYFKYMVYFIKAKSIDEKNDFYETLQSLRRHKFKKLNKKQLSLFSKWYYVVIRELINFCRFEDDYKSLAQMVEPPIKVHEAREAVEELESIGIIKKNRQGYYEQTDRAVTTGDEIQSYLVVNFQRSMVDLEKRALEKVPAEEREISGLTLTLSEKSFQKVKAEMRDVRKRIAGIAQEEEKPDKVFRCHFQMFPVSKRNGKG